MRDPRREQPGKLALAAAAVFAVVAKIADASAVTKGAVVLCFASLAAAYFLLPNRSAAAESTSDDDNSGGRQSLPSRMAWAVWLSLAAGACFGIAQLAGALTPALQLPFRVAGAVLLVVAAYKLFFARRGNNMDVDL